MRIGLLSDTHIPEIAETLPAEVFEAFTGVDLILHAGDVYDPAALDELERIAPVLAARGDDDNWPAARDDKRMEYKHVLNLSGQTLWLVHDRRYWVMKHVIEMGILKRYQEQNNNGFPNIIVHGHLHHPSIEREDDILYVNSGSPTFLDYQTGLGTVGILTIEPGKVDAQIVRLHQCRSFT